MNYPITRVRRKVLLGSAYRTIDLWCCSCKWGTHGQTIVYLFNEPKAGVKTTAIKWGTGFDFTTAKHHSVRVESVREDGFVFVVME